MTIKKKLTAKAISLAALVAVAGVLLALKNNERVCEFFATTFARGWIFLFGHIFGWLPVSVYEVLLIAAIAGAIVCLVLLIRDLVKKHWQKALSLTLSVCIAVASFLCVYTATASFSYNRAPLPQSVYAEYRAEDFSYEQAVELAENLIDKMNEAYFATEHDENGNIVYPYTFQELSDLVAQQYQRLTDDYFSSYTPPAKRILNKWIMSQMHIVGVFFAPTGEVNVNGNENNLFLPSTMAHEMAHAKGVMREYEADIVSRYVLATSENPYLCYGTLVQLSSYALSLVGKYPDSRQDYERLYNSVAAGIRLERQNYNEFYAQFTLLDDVGEFFNDIYLKLQQQQGGTESYEKPGETQGTGQVDGDGEEIVQIVRFSGAENLLIHLYKQGAFHD